MATSSPTSLVTVAVRVTGPFGKSVQATLALRRWSPSERQSRSFKGLLGCWALAPLVAVVPPHIPWLTLMLLAGPLVAWLRGREAGRIPESQLPCPDCDTPAVLEEQPETWPLAVRCRPCGNVLGIEQVG